MDSLVSDIQEITGAIWQALFEPELPLTVGGVASGDEGAVSIVVIDGARQAAVVTRFPTELAARLTMSMLRSPDAPTEPEILDAVGELCNMIAGNVKASIAGPSALRPPHGAIALKTDPSSQLAGAREVAVIPFTCADRVFTVTLLLTPAGEENP